MLKPCPLCGGKVRMYTTESVQSYRRAVIKCDACHLEMREEGGGYHDFATSSVDEKRKLSNERAKALATEKWNTRVDERTCHETVIDKFFRGCDSCGWMWEVFYSIGKRERPNYCPNCGAKVVDE